MIPPEFNTPAEQMKIERRPLDSKYKSAFVKENGSGFCRGSWGTDKVRLCCSHSCSFYFRDTGWSVSGTILNTECLGPVCNQRPAYSLIPGTVNVRNSNLFPHYEEQFNVFNLLKPAAQFKRFYWMDLRAYLYHNCQCKAVSLHTDTAVIMQLLAKSRAEAWIHMGATPSKKQYHSCKSQALDLTRFSMV